MYDHLNSKNTLATPKKINIGLVGFGYWGPNLARNLDKSDKFNLSHICDLDASRRSTAEKSHPDSVITASYQGLLDSEEIDAIAIATPVNTHYLLAKKALLRGKHVLVEKPITESLIEAEELVNIAEKNNLTLMVDHTFTFTGAVQKIKDFISDGQIGELFYYSSERVNLGIFQADVNVLWDLAVHDLSILNYLKKEPPIKVSACGINHVPGEPENIAFMTLFYKSSFMAHINVNWLSPVKLRRCLIGGSKKMIVYDELSSDEKIKVYDKGIELQDSPERKSLKQ